MALLYVMQLDNLNQEEVFNLELVTGIPIIYDVDKVGNATNKMILNWCRGKNAIAYFKYSSQTINTLTRYNFDSHSCLFLGDGIGKTSISSN